MSNTTVSVSFGKSVKGSPNEWEFISKLLCLLSESNNTMDTDRMCAVTITDNVLTELGCGSIEMLSNHIDLVRPALVKGRLIYHSNRMHGDFKKAIREYGAECLIGATWILDSLKICDCGIFKYIKAEFNPEYIRWATYMTGIFFRNLVKEIRVYDCVGEGKK